MTRGLWLLTLAFATAVPRVAGGVFLVGDGNGASECWIGFAVDGLRPITVSGTRRVRVRQQACAGACVFSAHVCLNNDGCEPASLVDVHILGRARLERPRAANPETVCGRPRTVTVPLRPNGRTARRKLVLMARAKGGGRDVDVVTLVCVPPPPGDRCARCGDGNVGPGELCDDGNAFAGDGCDPNCTPTACGNGVRAGDERCDDGNAIDGDGCDSNCTFTGCGNGIVTEEEECDPPGVALGPGLVCDRSCREEAIGECTCPSPEATRLVLATVTRPESCGAATAVTGEPLRQLDCGGLYIGGGDATVQQPIPVPAAIEAAFVVAGCSGKHLKLGQTTAETAGAPHRCTAPGCRFGPPLAAPNTLSASLSACIISTIDSAPSGAAVCDTGAADVYVPLRSEVYLTGGDQAANEPGLQACPVCLAGRCRGGANHGGPCTPYADGVLTSHDCPPTGPPLDDVSLELSFTTEPVTWNAVGAGTQSRVFCGYCRDADETLRFAEPAVACLEDGRGTTACAAPYESCEQRQQGAFGPNGGGVSTLTLAGAPAGPLVIGTPRDATLGTVFCVPPVAGDVVNANVSLPGPAALTLPVRMTLEGP